MENWQKEHLLTQRSKLLTETICNELIFSHLLSQGVLAKADEERIKRSTDRYEQAGALYDTVETRQNGFLEMARALANCNQTGARAVFTDGFSQHIIQKVKVDFLANTLSIYDLFTESEKNKIVDKIKSALSLEQLVNLCDRIQKEEPIKLIRTTIPEEIPHYVKRSLSKRVGVNPELFKVHCSEIFVFEGVNLPILRELVKPERVAFSSTQLYGHSTRFIVLEHADDYEEICKCARVPVHLIKFDGQDEGYVLLATTGGSTIIHQFLKSQGQVEDGSMSEDDFLERMTTSGVSNASICDLPGMGKSLLLANLARRMKERHVDRVVGFIEMSHFLAYALERKQKMGLLVLNTSLSRNVLLEYLTPSYFEFCILNVILDKIPTQLELFFDGFDEIERGQVDIAKQILTVLSSLSNTRMFVTSRPNMRHELEASLHTISYDILPFSHSNQIDFLAEFWSNLKVNVSKSKLHEFAEYCVHDLKKVLNKEDVEITGIPLQCRLVAEVFSRNATIFAHPSRNVDVRELCKIESSLSCLYKKYFELRLCRTIARPCQLNNSKSVLFSAAKQATAMLEAVVGEKCCLSEMHQIKEYHRLEAMRLIFPEVNELFSELSIAEPLTSSKAHVVSFGILQRQVTEDYESIQFVHRTFAEYLVAEYIASILHGDMDENEKLSLFLLKKWTSLETPLYGETCYTYPVVMYFFNSTCTEHRPFLENKLVIQTFESFVSGDRLYCLLEAIIRENHVNTFQLLKKLLLKMSRASLDSYKNSLFLTGRGERLLDLLQLSATYCTLFMVEQLFQLIRECFGIDLEGKDNHKLASLDYNLKNPLVPAVKRLDFNMVQLFAERIPKAVSSALKKCTSETFYKTPEEITRLLEIFTWLRNNDKHVAKELSHVLVMSNKVHLDVIKFWLENGVNPRETHKEETIVHRAAEYFTGNHFEELYRLLVDDFGAIDLFEEVGGKWLSPLGTLLANGQISNHTILMIYDLPWLDADEGEKTFEVNTRLCRMRIKEDINILDEDGNNFLMHAASGKRSVKTISRMLERGANVMAQNNFGDTFAHCIALYYTPEELHEIVQVLIEKKMGRVFKIVNKRKQTPFHAPVTMEKLLSKTLDLLVGRPHAQNAEQKEKENQKCFIDLNAVDSYGISILEKTLIYGRDVQFVKHLIKIGVDWSIKNALNGNMSHVSAYHGRLEYLKLFVELGCDINEVDFDGNNAHQNAVLADSEYRLEIVQFLVDKGAKKENINKKGKTADDILRQLSQIKMCLNF